MTSIRTFYSVHLCTINPKTGKKIELTTIEDAKKDIEFRLRYSGAFDFRKSIDINDLWIGLNNNTVYVSTCGQDGWKYEPHTSARAGKYQPTGSSEYHYFREVELLIDDCRLIKIFQHCAIDR